MFDIQEHLKSLPASPGVYIMKDRYGNVIYVGKAVSLKIGLDSIFSLQRTTLTRSGPWSKIFPALSI